MSELAGVLTFFCIIVWLGLAGFAFAKMSEGAERSDAAAYFWFSILLAPMMAAACVVMPPISKAKSPPNNPDNEGERE